MSDACIAIRVHGIALFDQRTERWRMLLAVRYEVLFDHLTSSFSKVHHWKVPGIGIGRGIPAAIAATACWGWSRLV